MISVLESEPLHGLIILNHHPGEDCVILKAYFSTYFNEGNDYSQGSASEVISEHDTEALTNSQSY